MNNTQKTSANLRILADYIEQHVPQDKLDMRCFRIDKNGCYTRFMSKRNCGKYGCALGWAPFVPHEDFKPQLSDFTFGLNSKLNFYCYSKRLFPKLGTRGLDWDGVFGSDLSSDKTEVVTRLRDKANELENRS